MEKIKQLPFIYGAQYYRAPTPEPEFWEHDLKRMREFGFNTVKFWVQWRWSERQPGIYYWDDLDRLMDLAQQNSLKVVLNLILDVMPSWISRKFSDWAMIDSHGLPVVSGANVCRQIGGYPGPCYNHSECNEIRKRFTREAVRHFAGHPALWMWDVWNEPENNLQRRLPNNDNLLCYCPNCEKKFKIWLQNKYGELEELNRIWGRCYGEFDDVEMPRNGECIQDFIDWREFHLDKLSNDAKWRLNTVKDLDPKSISHLHVVPNSGNCFNFVNCVDDFELAEDCQIFGASMTFNPSDVQIASAAGDRLFYNAEWHINAGCTSMHSRIIDRQFYLNQILRQLGNGSKGFLFWQYRAESLGTEAPGWGFVRSDGSSKPVTGHAVEFIETLHPYLSIIDKCHTKLPQIGYLRCRKNELFSYCIHRDLQKCIDTYTGYINALYEIDQPVRIISGQMLEKQEFDDLKLLIIPSVYYMTQCEAEAVDAFLQQGGMVFAEGHLAGYDGTNGRHSQVIPGFGLDQKWGVKEVESTSIFHMEEAISGHSEAVGDVKKALEAFGISGGEFLPIEMMDGIKGFGAGDFTQLEAKDHTIVARFGKFPAVIKKKVGKGTLFYSACELGRANIKDNKFLKSLLSKVITLESHSGLHINRLYDENDIAQFAVIYNQLDKETSVPSEFSSWYDIFHITKAECIPPGAAVLLALKPIG